MTEIRFYHLQSQTIDQALPALLTKAYEAGKRIVVQGVDKKRMEKLNAHLWTYHPDSFLPHGLVSDEDSAYHPICLSAEHVNPNESDMLILIDGAALSDEGALEKFSLCCEIFDGEDQEILSNARARWKSYKESDHQLTYWQQTPQGGWEQKA